jgi:hypothetical protein
MRAVNLAEHKDLIILWSQEHMTAANIISNLQADFGITVTLRTLQRRMQQWDITRYQKHSQQEIGLMKVRISVHYYANFNDFEIHRALNVEGFPIAR